MSATPFLQLYVGDYLADTLDLTTEQHGAYLLLLLTMWRHDARLPNDPAKLARIARVSPRRWHLIWGAIGHFFFVDGDKIGNKRLDREHQKAVSISEKRSVSGEKGGRAKALKTSNTPVANATDLPEHSQKSEPDIKKEEPKGSRSSGETGLLPLPIDDLAACFSAYNAAASRSGWPIAKEFTSERRKALQARMRSVGGVEGWLVAMKRAEDSDFLCGRTDKPFNGFCFDWITKKSNFTKLMEGNYDNRHPAGRPSRQSPADDPSLRAISLAVGLR
ncbi:YdaU family protein [Haematobacter massiliensis]|uniref:YdaU family protein n=1 Tax=Haematobacter massiliensis TaxID=195105 RepID=UPI0009FC05F5|nr:DUF1376 domain-containing protein [Haematobacter massiliensis]OWJ82730.1 hypothetical protein CDV51_17125 [Haematobacter massiliensis]